MNEITTQNNDVLSRFIFENHAVRGEWVNLSQTYQTILGDHNYPLPVQHLLGELLVCTCLLTATLKFDGDIAVQIQGDGPLSLAVINGNNHQQMRGVARVKGEINNNSSLKEMIGQGVMVITITPNQGERYQGIVGLDKETLTECIEDYFNQSEQLPTKLVIASGVYQNQPIATGMLLQVLPAAENENSAESFEHLSTLAATLKAEEMFSLPIEQLVYRLYHEEDVRLFPAQTVEFKCTCSRKRCEDSLMTVSAEEIDAIIAEEGTIDMNCDYCGHHYLFDKIDIEHLRSQIPIEHS